MPQIERWEKLPEGVRHHLIDRMRDREINVADLNQLRGSYPKTFLLRGQPAKGDAL